MVISSVLTEVREELTKYPDLGTPQPNWSIEGIQISGGVLYNVRLPCSTGFYSRQIGL